MVIQELPASPVFKKPIEGGQNSLLPSIQPPHPDLDPGVERKIFVRLDLVLRRHLNPDNLNWDPPVVILQLSETLAGVHFHRSPEKFQLGVLMIRQYRPDIGLELLP